MTDISTLREHRKLLISYLLSKAKVEDWHGVADAANDLREVDAQLSVLEPLESGGDFDARVRAWLASNPAREASQR